MFAYTRQYTVNHSFQIVTSVFADTAGMVLDTDMLHHVYDTKQNKMQYVNHSTEMWDILTYLVSKYK